LGIFSVWFLFIISFPSAYLRVSRSEKYHGSPFKSFSWEQTQFQNPADWASVSIPGEKTEEINPEPIADFSSPLIAQQDLLGKANIKSEQIMPIADLAKIQQLTELVYARINEYWQTWPSFSENLVYQIQVNEAGAIAAYKSINQSAHDYLQETPLPALVQMDHNTSTSLTQLTIIFTPDGVLEVTP
jgi:hypothetical protein